MDIKGPFSDAKEGSVSKVAGSRVGLVFQNQKMTCSRLSSYDTAVPQNWISLLKAISL